jgi:hypothetical protein
MRAPVLDGAAGSFWGGGTARAGGAGATGTSFASLISGGTRRISDGRETLDKKILIACMDDGASPHQ